MSLSFLTVIACGGEGRRFGAPKWSAELGGTTLIEHAIGKARGFGSPIALAVCEGMEVDASGVPHLIDDAENIGPVSALLSGFRHASEEGVEGVLLIACDQPFLPDDLASRLPHAIGDASVAAPHSNGHDQLMAALWRVDLPSLEDYVAGGGRSLWRYAEARGMVRVEWEGETTGRFADPFADIDDRSALKAAQTRWRAESKATRD